MPVVPVHFTAILGRAPWFPGSTEAVLAIVLQYFAIRVALAAVYALTESTLMDLSRQNITQICRDIYDSVDTFIHIIFARRCLFFTRRQSSINCCICPLVHLTPHTQANILLIFPYNEGSMVSQELLLVIRERILKLFQV